MMEYKICLHLISTNIFLRSTKDRRNMKYSLFCSNNKKKGSTVYAMFQFLKQIITNPFFFPIPEMLRISLNNDVIYLKTTSTVPLYNNRIKKTYLQDATYPTFDRIFRNSIK